MNPDFLNQVAAVLKDNPDRQPALDKVLHLSLAHFKSETGTIHVLDPGKQLLHLTAHSGLPPAMVDIVKTIPVGKGIAGQAVERRGPVTICNLQTDTSGTARPAARQTGVGGALCVPLRKGDEIVGTIGVGTIRQYQYTPEETRTLEEVGRLLAAHL